MGNTSFRPATTGLSGAGKQTPAPHESSNGSTRSPYFADVDPTGQYFAIPLVGGEVMLLDTEDGSTENARQAGRRRNRCSLQPGRRRRSRRPAETAPFSCWTVANSRPRWRAPALLTHPPLLLQPHGMAGAGLERARRSPNRCSMAIRRGKRSAVGLTIERRPHALPRLVARSLRALGHRRRQGAL